MAEEELTDRPPALLTKKQRKYLTAENQSEEYSRQQRYEYRTKIPERLENSLLDFGFFEYPFNDRQERVLRELRDSDSFREGMRRLLRFAFIMCEYETDLQFEQELEGAIQVARSRHEQALGGVGAADPQIRLANVNIEFTPIAASAQPEAVLEKYRKGIPLTNHEIGVLINHTHRDEINPEEVKEYAHENGIAIQY